MTGEAARREKGDPTVAAILLLLVPCVSDESKGLGRAPGRLQQPGGTSGELQRESAGNKKPRRFQIVSPVALGTPSPSPVGPLNFRRAEQGAGGFHDALAAGALEGVDAPNLEEKVAPEGAHVAGGLFGWGGALNGEL